MKIDYAQNYAHSHDVEFAQEHFSPWQTTILPVVCYYKTNTGPCVETVCALTPDLSHDNLAVQATLFDILQYYRVKFRRHGGNLQRFFGGSDGSAAQFKQKNQIGFLSAVHERYRTTSPASCQAPIVVDALDHNNIAFFDFKQAVQRLADDGIDTDFSGDRLLTAWSFSGSYHGKVAASKILVTRTYACWVQLATDTVIYHLSLNANSAIGGISVRLRRRVKSAPRPRSADFTRTPKKFKRIFIIWFLFEKCFWVIMGG